MQPVTGQIFAPYCWNEKKQYPANWMEIEFEGVSYSFQTTDEPITMFFLNIIVHAFRNLTLNYYR